MTLLTFQLSVTFCWAGLIFYPVGVVFRISTNERALFLPWIQLALEVSLQGPPSMSFQWSWALQVSTESAGHRPQRQDCSMLTLEPELVWA